MLGGDDDVIEDAEPHTRASRGVMSGGTDESVSINTLSGKNSVCLIKQEGCYTRGKEKRLEISLDEQNPLSVRAMVTPNTR